jgi:hypothetical protein
MKTLNTLFAISLLALMAGCGGNSNTSTAGSTSCGAGQIYASQTGGCVNTCNNGLANYGLVNGVCTYVTGTNSNSCSNGQVSTVSNGCVTSGGSCTASNGLPGVIANGTCLQVNTGANGSCSVGQVNTQNGCITQNGTCFVPGTNQPGTISNNACVAIIPSYPGVGGVGYPGYPGVGTGVAGSTSCSANGQTGVLVPLIIQGQNYGMQCGTYGQCAGAGLYFASYGCQYPLNNRGVRPIGGGGIGFSIGFGI